MHATATRGRRIAHATLLLVATATLPGCLAAAQDGIGRWRGTHHLQTPPGPGPGIDETKQSPCACRPVPLEPSPIART